MSISTNLPPSIEDQVIEIDEDTIDAGLVIGGIIATDPDVGDVLNYDIIGGTGADVFGVCAGLPSFDCGIFTMQPLDFSGNQQFELIVEVTDTGLLSDSAVITIQATQASTIDELLIGTLDADTLNGQDGNDTLRGLQSNDTLIGGRGNDRLFGNRDNDRLLGNSGHDLLVGNQGDDRLIGGHGVDSLRGGTGEDKFIFRNVRHGADRILDFNTQEDIILISKTGFNLDLPEGRLNNSRFAVGSGAKDKNDRFIYDSQIGTLMFDIDGMRQNEAVVIANLNQNINLNANNIRII